MTSVETPDSQLPKVEPAWSLTIALLFVGLWLMLLLLTNSAFLVAALLLTAASRGVSVEDAALALQNQPPNLAQLVALVGCNALTWIATFAFMRRLLRHFPRHASLHALGFNTARPHWVWAVAPVVAVILLAAGELIAQGLGVEPEDSGFAQLLKTRGGAIAIAVMALGIAPFAEELFFRGFVYPPMRRRFSLGSAMACNGFVFALAHIPTYGTELGYLPPLFLFGFVLSGIRDWTGSIYPGVLIHFIFNGLSIAAFFLIEQQP